MDEKVEEIKSLILMLRNITEAPELIHYLSINTALLII